MLGAFRGGTGLGAITNQVYQWEGPLAEFHAVAEEAARAMRDAEGFTGWYLGTRDDIGDDGDRGGNQPVIPAFSP